MRSFNQHLIEKAVSKAEAKKLFGKILFGDLQGAREYDTNFESAYSTMLRAFVINNDHNPAIVKAFKFLQDNTKHFPEVLHNSEDPLYRGVIVPFDKLLKLGFRSGVPGVPPGYVVAKFNYKAHEVLQSWSTKYNVAWSFVIGGADGKMKISEVPKIHLLRTVEHLEEGPPRMGVVLIAKPNIKDKDSLFSAKFMNKVSQVTLGHLEFEVVRNTKKPIPVLITMPGESWAAIQNHFASKKGK